MKRIFALLLILATMLGLCACGKADQRKALSDMGITNREDQDTLIEAANSLYAEDTSNKPKSDAQMEKIYEESRKQYGSQLEGRWISLSFNYGDNKSSWLEWATKSAYVIEGSKCTKGANNTNYWLVEDGKILVGDDMERGKDGRWVAEELELIQMNGIDILRSTSAYGIVSYLVREKNAEALYDAMFLEVELNAENVRDYYELIEVRQDQIDNFQEKTGAYKKSIFLCNTAYKEGLYCIDHEDILIEVNYPRFDYIKGSFNYHTAGTYNVCNPNYQEILEIYRNFVYESEAVLSPEDLTLGRAKGTLKYLRPEYIEHIEEKKTDYRIYDVFGNEYCTYFTPTPPDVTY